MNDVRSAEKDNDDQSCDSLILHILDEGGAQNLLRGIQLVVLIAEKHNLKNVKICLHKRSILRPRGLRRWLRQLINVFGKEEATEGFWHTLRHKGSTEVVAYGISIELFREKINFPTRALLVVRALAWSAREVVSNIKVSDDAKFLNIQLNKIPAGKYAAAIALRREVRAGGDLSRSMTKYFYLIDCVALVMQMASRSFDAKTYNYFSVTDEAYVGGLYEHFFYWQGHGVISQNTPKAIFESIGSEAQLNSPRSLQGWREALSEENIEECEKHMKARFEDPVAVLHYMEVGSNDASYIPDPELDEVQRASVASSRINVVIFLHAFSDAQYIFGVDGFPDIYAWTKHTLGSLVNNSIVENILIKPHPNIDVDFYRADKVALDKLKSEFSTSKVRWLLPTTNLEQIARTPRVVGVTHHGSVAEELTYLGIPVVASTYAPWSDQYKFCFTWSTRSQYSEVLDGISEIWDNSHEGVEFRRSELYAYIHNFRSGKSKHRQTFPKLFDANVVNDNMGRVERNVAITAAIKSFQGKDITDIVSRNDDVSLLFK